MNIYVGNLSFDETESSLEASFANHGEVTSARIITAQETDQILKHRKLKPHSFNKLCLLTLENPFLNLFMAPLFLVNLTI